MPILEWFRPPRQLLTLYLAGTFAAAGTLALLGFRLFAQEKALSGQRAQERLELAADRAAASFQRRLGSLERGLTIESAMPAAGTVILDGDDRSLHARPMLLFYPAAEQTDEAPAGTFSNAEQVEFAQSNPVGAIALYRELARSRTPSVRAGALMRLGRCLRGTGQAAAALPVYQDLAGLGDVQVEGLPADLAGRELRCTTLESLGRRDLLAPEALELLTVLGAGRRGLTRDSWEFLAQEAKAWAGNVPATTTDWDEKISFAQAAEALWKRMRELPAGGLETATFGNSPVLMAWAAAPGKLRAVMAGRTWIEAARREAGAESGAEVALLDRDGRLSMGSTGGIRAVRSAAESRLPWSVSVSNPNPSRNEAEDRARRQMLSAVLSILGCLILGSAYFTFRGIRRELAVARLQSEFVSAVSHEFRTPLTSMRQLSDMLVKGRVPSEDRRQQYYEVLARESVRLHRLVERLLNFGRAEAGTVTYRFEPLDIGDVVRSVAGEFQSQSEECRIELTVPDAPCMLKGEREMLGLALWNLLDNAIKYSPENKTAWVGVAPEGNTVAISVRDRGVGIPRNEQTRIFQKFVRGASAAGVKGTGIGLALVDHVIKAHGGHVRVESEPGSGSTFTIILPRI